MEALSVTTQFQKEYKKLDVKLERPGLRPKEKTPIYSVPFQKKFRMQCILNNG